MIGIEPDQPDFEETMREEMAWRNAPILDESGFSSGAAFQECDICGLPDCRCYDPDDFRDIGGMGVEPR
jgi:hypothetical protein